MFAKVLLAAALVAAPVPASDVSMMASQCEPAPVVAQTANLALNSTYVSDGMPPARFRQMPAGYVRVRFGAAAIDELCGRPPCDKVFLGCVRNETLVLRDPCLVKGEDYAKIVCHELAHFAGWPATHGD